MELDVEVVVDGVVAAPVLVAPATVGALVVVALVELPEEPPQAVSPKQVRARIDRMPAASLGRAKLTLDMKLLLSTMPATLACRVPKQHRSLW